MNQQVKVERKIFGVNTFKNVVDTNFKQLIPQVPSVSEAASATVDSFFQDYDQLFYQIPLSGSDSSHLSLVNRSSEYLGISFQDLINELLELREENTSLKNQLFTITQVS